MSWRTTGILFVILLVLAAILFLPRGQDADGNATATTTAPVTETVSLFDGITIEEVARLDVTRHDAGAAASFERAEDGSWFMTVPTATQVVSQTMNSQVQGLINLNSRRTLSPGPNSLTAYGLDDASGEITVAVRRDGETVRFTLFVGNATPADDAYYVHKEGDPRIHLLTKFNVDNILELVDEPPLPEPDVTPSP